MTAMQFDTEMQTVLRQVQVNLPWIYLPRYLDLVLANRINPEIGIGGEEMDRVERRQFHFIAEKLHQSECRITLHGPFWDLCPGSVDPLIRQATRLRLHQFFDLVPIFKPVQVVCHTGYDSRHHGGSEKDFIDRSLAIWEPLVERAEAMQVALLVENVWEKGPEFHSKLFERLPSPYFGFCLDVGHQHSFSSTPFSMWLESLIDPLMELHLHDNDGARDAHLPVGHGTIDFDLLFRRISGREKPPILTIEPHREEDFPQALSGLAPLLARYPLGRPKTCNDEDE